MPRKNTNNDKPSTEVEFTSPQELQEGGKVAFQIRFEAELHSKLKAAADQSGMSLNQLLQGICSACIENIHIGEPDIQPGGYVHTKQVRKCAFFGKTGYRLTEEEQREAEREIGEPVAKMVPGKLWFSLDYSERNFKTYE